MSSVSEFERDMTGFPTGWEIRDGHWQLTAKELQKRTEAAEEKQAEQKRQQQRTAAESPQMTAREKALARAVVKELAKRDKRITELEAQVKDLQNGSGSAERIAELIGKLDVANLKIEALERRADANHKHIQNVDGRIGRLKQQQMENALPTFNPARENL